MSWVIEALEVLLSIAVFGLAFVWSILTGLALFLIFVVWRDKQKDTPKEETFVWQTQEKLKDER